VRSASPAVVVLTVICALGSIGFGLFAPAAPVFFVRIADIPAPAVGVGFSVAALAGLIIGQVGGRLADRLGGKQVMLAFAAALAAFLLVLPRAETTVSFMVVLCLVLAAEQGWDLSREAVIANIVAGPDRVRISALMRSIFNAGFTLGAFLGGVLIAVGSRTALEWVFYGHAITVLIGAALGALLPSRRQAAAAPAEEADRTSRLRVDWSYLAVAQLAHLNRIADTVLLIGIPLWVTAHPDLPRSLASWAVGINTILVVLFQVRLSRRSTNVPTAVRTCQFGFVAIAVACVGLAVTDVGTSTVLRLGVLIAAVVAMTIGEMWVEAGKWTLRFDLAPDGAQGAYGGLFRLGTALPIVAGPALVVWLSSSLGGLGWLLLLTVALLPVLALPATTAWAVRSRPEEVPTRARAASG